MGFLYVSMFSLVYEVDLREFSIYVIMLSFYIVDQMGFSIYVSMSLLFEIIYQWGYIFLCVLVG